MSFLIALIGVICSKLISEAIMKTVIAVLSLLCDVLYVVGAYKVFEKAGEKGWYAIIPILNDYKLFKISWSNSSMYLPYLILSVIVQYNENKGNSGIFTLIFSVALIIVQALFADHLAKAFGRNNIWYKLGLFFFQPIFLMMLGFGDAEYIGPQN